MTGISEVLILILIIICLLIIPRFFKTGEVKSLKSNKKKSLSPGLRIFIIFSIFLPVVSAIVVKPWIQNFNIFVSVGVLPVLLAWSVYWIMIGFKKR